ncbi:MAG: hypothetical protein RL518_1578 [Pseudomonadota bacterium]|jgi:ABC-type uncharacterized transport system involved in gliding motility auxiliary subunit
METTLRFSGYIGSVLLAFGVLGSLIVGSFTSQPLVVLQLILGGLFLILWIVTSGVSSLSKATQVIAGRSARFGYNAVLYTVVFIGLVVVANVFVIQNNQRWDLTEEGVYSLSEKSVNVVKGLTKPLRLVAMDTSKMMSLAGGVAPERVRELLELYKYHNQKEVSFEILDPRTKPVEVERLGMKQGNLLYLEYGEGDQSSMSRINTVDEQSVTNAIVKLTKGISKKIYYIEGHGEPDIGTDTESGMRSFVDALEDEHLTVEGLMLPRVGKIPEDAAAVMLVAPKLKLQPAEQEALVEYVNKGGRLIMLANPEDGGNAEVQALAKRFDIEVGNDVILDAESQMFFGGPQIFVAMAFSPHAITAKLSGRQPPVFSFSSSVQAPKGEVGGGIYTELLKTGPNSWAERDVARLFDAKDGKASFGADDLKGPVPIAVAMERTISQGADKDALVSRVVVVGDATWLRNDSFGSMGNRDLILNTVNWAAGEEGSIAIGPKQMRRSMAVFSQATIKTILALSFLGPELMLLLGLFIWWRRQQSVA